MLVAICVITCQRAEGLKRLLNGLNQLSFDKCPTPRLEVIVVDNDATGSAHAVYESMSSQFQWSLKYSLEPQRGISYARNHAIASISPEAEIVAFIDDDEVPEPNWLDELLFVQQMYKADVVSGPVLPYFVDKDVPNWVVEGKFFELRRYPTGYPLKVAFTNNVLVQADILRKATPVFDQRFALTGGEDSYFFMRLHRMGYKMVWADEALVREWIPKSRTNIGWILRRGYRSWSTHSLCERELEPSLKVQAIRMAKGFGLIVYGLLLLFPSVILKRHQLIKALLHISRGCGTFSGLAGWQYQEYKVIHKV